MKSKQSLRQFKKYKKTKIPQKQINSDIILNFQTFEKEYNALQNGLIMTKTYSKIPIINSKYHTSLTKCKFDSNSQIKAIRISEICSYNSNISAKRLNKKIENKKNMKYIRPLTAENKQNSLILRKAKEKYSVNNKELIIPKKIGFKEKFDNLTFRLAQNSNFSQSINQRYFYPSKTQIMIERKIKKINENDDNYNIVKEPVLSGNFITRNRLITSHLTTNINLAQIKTNPPNVIATSMLNNNVSKNSKKSLLCRSKNGKLFHCKIEEIIDESKSSNNFYGYLKNLLKYSSNKDGKLGLNMLKEKLDLIEKNYIL